MKTERFSAFFRLCELTKANSALLLSINFKFIRWHVLLNYCQWKFFGFLLDSKRMRMHNAISKATKVLKFGYQENNNNETR